MALSFDADEKFREIFGHYPKQSDIEILKKAMVNEIIEGDDQSLEDSINSLIEAFKEDLDPSVIDQVIEKNAYMLMDPDEVLPKRMLMSIERVSDRFHSLSGSEAGGISNLNYNINNILNKWKRLEERNEVHQFGVPEIYAKKDSRSYDFLVLDDFTPSEEHMIGGYRTLLFKAEPTEGYELGNMLENFAEERKGLLEHYIHPKWKRHSAALAVSAGFLTHLSPIAIAGLTYVAFPITATAITIGATVPHLRYRSEGKRLDDSIREITEEIDSRFVEGYECEISLGSKEPYDPEILKRAKIISQDTCYSKPKRPEREYHTEGNMYYDSRKENGDVIDWTPERD